MHIFRYVILAFIYIVVPLVSKILCCLEIDHIPAILLPCEDAGQCVFVPAKAVIFIKRSIFISPTVMLFHLKCWCKDFLVFILKLTIYYNIFETGARQPAGLLSISCLSYN